MNNFTPASGVFQQELDGMNSGIQTQKPRLAAACGSTWHHQTTRVAGNALSLANRGAAHPVKTGSSPAIPSPAGR